MLGHLRDRPLTRIRYPNGVDEKFFYEKNCPDHRPDWVQVARINTRGTGRWGGEGRGPRDIDFCLANDLATLVWLANLAALELHTSLGTADGIRPADDGRVRPRPGPAGDDRRVLPRRPAAARHVRAARDELLPEDVRLEGHAGLSPAQHAGHLRRDDAVRARRRRAARAGASRTWWSRSRTRSYARARCSSTGARTWTSRRPCASTRCGRASGRRSRRRSRGTRSRRRASRTTFASRPHEVLERVERHGDLYAPVLELEQRLPAGLGG